MSERGTERVRVRKTRQTLRATTKETRDAGEDTQRQDQDKQGTKGNRLKLQVMKGK